MYNKISGNNIEKMSDTTINAISHFKITDDYVLGGDCDKDYHSPFINKNDSSLFSCAEECLKNEKCQRFSFGKFNLEGGDGLGCRISTDGKCPITIDRFSKEKQEGKELEFNDKIYGLNFYNGQIYDKLSQEELEKVKSNSKSEVVIKSKSSSKSIINNEIIEDEKKSNFLKIVDGKIVKNEINGINMLNNTQESADNTPESADNTPESADNTQESADNTQESADNTPESADNTPESADRSTLYIISGVITSLVIIGIVIYIIMRNKKNLIIN